jgi:hypothetical protein
MMPILFTIFNEKYGLLDLRERVGTFDRKFCRPMKGNEALKDLAEDPWDTYRDLDKVFKHIFCKKHNFNIANTILIDSDNSKLQLWM